ncbi:MAG: sulfur carrier protein ThiS [Desulfuromonadales bacterium]|nr:sulfur carrier protein ThiS [Desulfuromonadales bacterium]MBN2792235.1 sulfur carrier protein ThiS [Desulfuromonadales bacterium]
MQLKINGDDRIFTAPLTVEQLLLNLELKSEHVVVELNRVILDPHHFTETLLSSGDSLELIQFVGGG